MDMVTGSNIVIVASGKEGVGKTWFAVSLAQSLARHGKSVLLFDADFRLASISGQLGVTPEQDLSTVLEGQCDVHAAVLPYRPTSHPDFPVMDLVANRPVPEGTISSPKMIKLRQSLMKLSTTYDHVIVDLGTGIDEVVQDVSELGQKCIVVVTEESTSLTDAYAYIKVMNQKHPKLGVQIVVNTVSNEKKGGKAYETLARVCQEFLNRRPPLLGLIHKDPRVLEALKDQVPFWTRYPTAQPTRDVDKISQRVINWA